MLPRLSFVRVGCLVATVVMLAACSGSDSDDQPRGADIEPTPLFAALLSVADSESARRGFEWSNLERLYELAPVSVPLSGTGGEAALDDNELRWSSLFSVGGGPLVLTPLDAGDAGDHAVDTRSARDGIATGPRGVVNSQAFRIDGIDVDRALQNLIALGGRAQTVAGRDGVVLDKSTGERVWPHSPQVRHVSTVSDQLAYAYDEASLMAAFDGTPNLADDRTYRETAACLGNVLAASLFVPLPEILEVPVDLLGVGVLDPASPSDPVREVVCVHAPTSDDAEAVQQILQKRVDTNTPSIYSPFVSRSVARPDSDDDRLSVRVEMVVNSDLGAAGQVFDTLSGASPPEMLVNHLIGIGAQT